MEPGTRPYQTAQMLLRLGAVALRPSQPFRYTSGLLSPIYCDNRILISHPQERLQVARWFAQLLHEEGIPVETIAGTATAGIPHAAWLAAELDLPMVYVRSKAKGHGKERLVEGLSPAGQRVVVVEDLVTTGGSSLGSVMALRQEGATVEHVLAIFTYGFAKTYAAFSQAGIQLHALTTLPALLDVAVAEGYLSSEEKTITEEWAHDATGWSEAREGQT